MIGAAGLATFAWTQDASASSCGPTNNLDGSDGFVAGCQDAEWTAQNGYYGYLYATNTNGDYTEAIWITSGNQGSIGTASNWNYLSSPNNNYYGIVYLFCSNGTRTREGAYFDYPSLGVSPAPSWGASESCPSGTTTTSYFFLASVT